VIIKPPSPAKAQWAEKATEKPALKGLRRANKANPEIRVRAQHLKTKGTLRHATVKALLDD
jgi:hypothetical protein